MCLANIHPSIKQTSLHGELANVLVVEDEPELRSLVAEYLDFRGFSVVQARDGSEAWNLLTSGTRFDCILTDLAMPVMDGARFLRLMAADSRFFEIPVVVMTAGEPTPVPSQLPGNVRSVIRKPFSLTTVVTAVRNSCVRSLSTALRAQ